MKESITRKIGRKLKGVFGDKREEKLPLSGDAVTLGSLDGQDPESNVEFYDTENSEVARGAPRSVARGIDKFGEKDTFDPDEADENQTERDRNQNSDLSKRFFTHGHDFGAR